MYQQPEMITAEEFRKRYRISRSTEWRLVRDGLLPPAIKIGRRNFRLADDSPLAVS